jgi:epoxyqueuosine reductase
MDYHSAARLRGQLMGEEITVQTLREFCRRFVAAEGERSGDGGWWRAPLVATAPVDERFAGLRRIAAQDHFHPRDLLPTAKSIVVFFIPFREGLVRENSDGDRPCRNWGLAYVQTNDLIGRLSTGLSERLREQGFASALTPATHNFDEERLVTRWSHKHLGYLVGLGRFGVHSMLITPSGCCGRLGSLVSEAEIGDHPLIAAGEACILKAGGDCGQCMGACPVEALRENGFDRRRCWERLKENRHTLDYFFDLPETTHVCGKCAAMMPCSFRNPIAMQSGPPAGRPKRMAISAVAAVGSSIMRVKKKREDL